MSNIKPVFVIQTFTLITDFGEDRIRMNVVDSEGAAMAIWLTRRLLDRFLPFMVKHIETKVSPSLPIELSLSLSQQKLRQERQENPCQPVAAPMDGLKWLATRMQLVTQKEGAVWVLMGDEGQRAQMFLTDANVRATLDILHNNYRTMEWGRDHFPEWIVCNVDQKPAFQSALH